MREDHIVVGLRNETLTCTGHALIDGSCYGKDLSSYAGTIICQDIESCRGLSIGSEAIQPYKLLCLGASSCAVRQL